VVRLCSRTKREEVIFPAGEAAWTSCGRSSMAGEACQYLAPVRPITYDLGMHYRTTSILSCRVFGVYLRLNRSIHSLGLRIDGAHRRTGELTIRR
jgi:hypothetical protein